MRKGNQVLLERLPQGMARLATLRFTEIMTPRKASVRPHQTAAVAGRAEGESSTPPPKKPRTEQESADTEGDGAREHGHRISGAVAAVGFRGPGLCPSTDMPSETNLQFATLFAKGHLSRVDQHIPIAIRCNPLQNHTQRNIHANTLSRFESEPLRKEQHMPTTCYTTHYTPPQSPALYRRARGRRP